MLRVYVGNKVLSDGQRPRRPRPLSYFLNCLCVYYSMSLLSFLFTNLLSSQSQCTLTPVVDAVGSAVFAAVTRIVIAQSFFFTRFCMLHSSPFTPWWQQ